MKKSRKRRKSINKKGKSKKAALKKEEPDFEEITLVCPGCGRQVKMIKLKGLNTEGLLCQRCAEGEIETDTG